MNMEKGYDAVVKNSEKITDFIAKTRKKYEHLELHDYKLYHILAGSNEISGTIKHFDLPEREFEKFLCDL
jgi:hypothetical protein